MWGPTYQKTDVESGSRPLYPMMLESPELRWSFIRKIYTIVSIQLLLTIAVASVVVTVHPISRFFTTTGAGLALYIVLIITPFIVLFPLYYYYQKHPVNYLLLGIFTVALASAVGLTCAYTSGKVILEAVILTAVVVVSLTLYTFWAARRGQDFNFLGPFLFGAIIVLMVFAFIQILFPLGRISVMIYGALASIIFCGYIVYDTDNLIKRYTYDEYIWAAVALYLDVINLFLSLLTLFRAADTLVVSHHSIAHFFKIPWIGIIVYVDIILVTLIVQYSLYCYRSKHPFNFVLLGIFTLCFGFALGILCSFVSGKVVIETAIATISVVIILTVYTFWAAKRGQDFGFLVPLLLSTLVVLIMFIFFQIFFPKGKVSQILYSGLYAIIFSAFIIYDTDTLIKRSS
ncbi:hypothetical protein BUALT_Bualt02G0215700 [Buddleja alternifolia]|uniref:Uncharacterized protein n=1 Tax=Buddleja alternifolia TaxID=168488 RepID=A0AAV6Y269_9LAMI|nr:hypothetical protein BUALT_Bualt02G0215700 [Buddleja alternifolia]